MDREKNSNNEYVTNFTDLPLVNLINFQEFKLVNIITNNEEATNRDEVIIELEGNVDNIEDINLQHAKISQSHFTKGLWLDGIWENDDIKSKQDELLATLKETYNVSFEVTTNVEVLGKNES